MLSGIVINVLYPFPYFKFQSGGQIGFPVQSEIFVFEEKGSLIGTFLLMWKVLLVKELLLYFSFLAHSIISDRSPVCGSLVCNWNTNNYILYLSAKMTRLTWIIHWWRAFSFQGSLWSHLWVVFIVITWWQTWFLDMWYFATKDNKF